MKKSKLFVLVVALGMMVGAGVYLEIHHQIHLSAPGVKVGQGSLFDENKHLVAKQCVLLPNVVLGLKGTTLPVTQAELDALPKDTTFGRKQYLEGNNFNVVTSVVLMGTDRTSIHQPQFCLDAAGWHIEQTDRVRLPMDRPYSYEVPALKLTTSRLALNEFKQPIEVRGIYVYWFVTANNITADQGSRMWSLAKTMLKKRELERWAYISYFTTCLPGQEKATFEQLERFIRASVPEFQTVTGQSSARHLSVAAR
jgi:Protein of unknown function (DUF3485)